MAVLPPSVLAGVLAMLAAGVVAASLTPVVASLALRLGVVAMPRGDRWHTKPTPMLGGVALFCATLLVAFLALGAQPGLAGLLAGAVILFLLGLVDDVRRMRPHIKLLGQIAAACVLILGGVRVEIVSPQVLSIPLTVLWVVGITNAVNLLDNMDGLAAGIVAIAAFMLSGFLFSGGEPEAGVLAMALVGATLGFWIHNTFPARIFMGDSGSMFLGFLLAALALMGTHHSASDLVLTLLLPAAVLVIPILDTTLVTFVRTLHGRSPAQGGADHLSHRLVALGLTDRQAVLVLYLIGAGFGVVGLAAEGLGLFTTLVLAALLLIVVGLFGLYVAQVRVYTHADYQALASSTSAARRLVLGGNYLYKRQAAEVLLDFVLICLAYLGAYLLKYEGNLEGAFLVQFSLSAPYVIVLKLACLFAFRIYGSIWRYMGVRELSLIALASASGSLLSALFIAVFFGFADFSRSVLVIDWLLLTVMLGATRGSQQLLQEWFGSLRRKRGARLLVVGAGDVGEMLVRAGRRSADAGFEVVGFVDDDLAKQQRSVRGVRVLGTLSQLRELIVRQAVEAIALALPQDATAARTYAERVAGELGLPCREALALLDREAAPAPNI